MTTLYNKIPKEFLCSSKLEDHKYVKRFEEKKKSDFEYKQTLIEAYIVRDLYYEGKLTIKELFEKHCNKLHLNPSQEEQKKKREYEFLQSISLMMKNHTFEEELIQDHYNKFINRKNNNRELENKSKYDEIMQMIEENEDIEDIYNIFSIEDLHYLGW